MSYFICNVHFFIHFEDQECGCYRVGDVDETQGCAIDPAKPPPKGYKCNCQHKGFLCEGKAIPCESIDEYGCSGCAEKECCSNEGLHGDCNGYDGMYLLLIHQIRFLHFKLFIVL